MTTAERFADYLRKTARDTGYPIHRRHGRNALARDAGMTRPDMERALNGHRLPEPNELERLATALDQSLMQLLLDSGIVPPRDTEGTAQ